ncbi:hypothetical protein FOZ63_031886 [Perkinsus olseni]|uniref:Uncharacterized protein n=1 Tax=Perkinsus olseni TaxID=32597 RepID=A0A7J6T6Y8_PEROL|nr:hypothetical protein FOZ63_031886 [Perkinsus olseni]
MDILKLLVLTVCCCQADSSETIPPGVYQTTQSVSTFAGVALRVFEGRRKCAVVFLCGTPELPSFETPVMDMMASSSEEGCYLLMGKGRRPAAVLRMARSMTIEYGQRVDFSIVDVLPCIRAGKVSMKVGPSTLRMTKISNDPHFVFEKPLQLPSPGVSRNDGLIDDSPLREVTRYATSIAKNKNENPEGRPSAGKRRRATRTVDGPAAKRWAPEPTTAEHDHSKRGIASGTTTNAFESKPTSIDELAQPEESHSGVSDELGRSLSLSGLEQAVRGENGKLPAASDSSAPSGSEVSLDEDTLGWEAGDFDDLVKE